MASTKQCRTAKPLPEGATPLELDIVNTPYGQPGFEFETAFVQTLGENYGARHETPGLHR